MNIAVVIPYYQTQPGILRRAISSILSQEIRGDVSIEVFVTDDGSPAPAEPEIEGLAIAPPFQIRLIKQQNGGVASARNAALRAIAPDTDIIGFLNSDDMWEKGHLAAAREAFDRGADFFFCDSKRDHHGQTRFADKSFPDFLSHHGKEIGPGLFELNHSAFYDHSLHGRAFLTPAVLYRRSIKPDHLFNEQLRFAGEDCLFFFELIAASRRAFCSTHLNVLCGKGVNIHAGRFGWDNPGNLTLHMAQLLACYSWRKKLPLTPEQDRFIARRIKNLRSLFAFLSIRNFLKRGQGWSAELKSIIRNDPDFGRWYPLYALYVAFCYPLKLYDPLGPW